MSILHHFGNGETETPRGLKWISRDHGMSEVQLCLPIHAFKVLSLILCKVAGTTRCWSKCLIPFSEELRSGAPLQFEKACQDHAAFPSAQVSVLLWVMAPDESGICETHRPRGWLDYCSIFSGWQHWFSVIWEECGMSARLLSWHLSSLPEDCLHCGDFLVIFLVSDSPWFLISK